MPWKLLAARFSCGLQSLVSFVCSWTDWAFRVRCPQWRVHALSDQQPIGLRLLKDTDSNAAPLRSDGLPVANRQGVRMQVQEPEWHVSCIGSNSNPRRYAEAALAASPQEQVDITIEIMRID